MTVEELINELSGYPNDATVRLICSDDATDDTDIAAVAFMGESRTVYLLSDEWA